MNQVTAMTIGIGVLGALANFLTATTLPVPIWVVFIAWASFFVMGGGIAGLGRAALAGLTGVAIASLTLLLIAFTSAGAVLASVLVGLGSAAMVQASRIPVISVVPCIVFGFASTVGTTMATGEPITSLALDNPGLVAAVAVLAGAAFGFAHETMAGWLASQSAADTAEES